MTDEELNNLISQTDLVSLISKYVTLEKKGKNYMGCCPFHNEKTPSFVVSPEKGMYNCFGCHKGGNALKFIKDIENVDTKHAIKILCDFNGVEFKDNFNNNSDNLNSNYYKIMDTAKNFYKVFLEQDVSGLNALSYLEKRGLNKDIIDTFDIGLSPKNKDTIYQVLLKSGFNELDASDMALIDKNDKGYYDIFSGRIMFPIKDELGHTVAFSARIYDNPDKNQPKYINSRETKIFHKGEILFNLNLAKSEINKKHRAILHEGQMDVIASYKSGLKEAICSLGTGLTKNHISLLKKYTNNVIICYDGDKAGIEASIKAIDNFKNAGFNVHLVLLPDKMDPDEYVLKYGIDEYIKYFEANIIDDIEYRYRVLFIDKNLSDKTILDKVRIDAFNIFRKIDSEIAKEKYLNRLAKDLNASIDAVKNDFINYINSLSNVDIVPYNELYPEIKIPKKKKTKNYKNLAELKIFLYARESRQMAKEIDKKIEDSLSILSKENQDLWFTLINDYYTEFEEFDERIFVQKLNDEQYDNYLKLLGDLNKEPLILNFDDLTKCIEKINELGAKARINNLDKNIKSNPNSDEAIALLNEKFKKLSQVEKKRSK